MGFGPAGHACRDSLLIVFYCMSTMFRKCVVSWSAATLLEPAHTRFKHTSRIQSGTCDRNLRGVGWKGIVIHTEHKYAANIAD